MVMGLCGAPKARMCACRASQRERWTVAAVRTSHAPMPLLSKPAMLLSDCSVWPLDAVWKDMCCLRGLPCTAPQLATALGTGLRLGACPGWAVMYPAPWSEEAGHCAGIATGVGIRTSGDPTSKTVRRRPSNIGACNSASSLLDITPR